MDQEYASPAHYKDYCTENLGHGPLFTIPPDEGQEEIKTLLHILINKVDWLSTSVNSFTQDSGVKRARRPRTEVNRCQHRNRRGESCRSYICKKSAHLCHAHYSLYSEQSSSNYLYGHK